MLIFVDGSRTRTLLVPLRSTSLPGLAVWRSLSGCFLSEEGQRWRQTSELFLLIMLQPMGTSPVWNYLFSRHLGKQFIALAFTFAVHNNYAWISKRICIITHSTSKFKEKDKKKKTAKIFCLTTSYIHLEGEVNVQNANPPMNPISFLCLKPETVALSNGQIKRCCSSCFISLF